MSVWIFAAWCGAFGFLGGLLVELFANSGELNALKRENASLREELAKSRALDLDDILSDDKDFA